MASDEPVLRMEQIDKRFPGVHALDHVDFDVHQGEVHVLLGENGAGKSTLMKILSGSLAPDSGRIFIRGRPVSNLTPETARELGIGMVYQELSLVPSLSVAENVYLGRLPRNRMQLVDWPSLHRRTRQHLAELRVDIDPTTRVRTLDIASQQLTEVARVLACNPSILLLDEPASALSDAERERLFEIIGRLRQRGVAIVYITHRLGEVSQIGQRVTVLRDGKRIATLPVEEVTKDRLIQMMVGRRLAEHYPKHTFSAGDPVLQVRHLSIPDVLHDLSFELHRGEILGIFGLMGAGQTELSRALFGLEPKASAEVWIAGERTSLVNPAQAIRRGLGFLPRDRREALVPMLPIPPNVTLGLVSQLSPLALLNLRREHEVAGRFVRELRIQPPSLDRLVVFLSGGNQQKVVLSRWLCSDARILLLDDPTRGIDVGAKAEVFALMAQLAEQGVGIIFISSEMHELIGMADRILVLKDGRFVREFARGEASHEELLQCAS